MRYNAVNHYTEDNTMKRLLSILLALCLLVPGLSGCSAVSTEKKTPTPDEQREILMRCYNDWAFLDSYAEPWYYTFTDLDHNGRLEVIAASTQGSGIFTYLHCREVTEDFTGAADCVENPEGEWMDWPEVICKSLPCYNSPDGTRHYVVTNLTRDGAAHYYESVMDLCLTNGVLTQTPLAFRTTEYTPDEHISCTDAQGQPIGWVDFEHYAERYFDALGAEAGTLELTWEAVGLEESP